MPIGQVGSNRGAQGYSGYSGSTGATGASGYSGYSGSAAIGAITGSTGSTDNAALRADGTGGATLQNSALVIADTTGALTFAAKTKVDGGTADGNLNVTDNAGTSVGGVHLGPSTSSFPFLKYAATNGPFLEVKLGDDASYAGIGTTQIRLYASGTSSRKYDINSFSANFYVASDIGFTWDSTTLITGSIDTGIFRSAAGVVEINNGTVGTYRDVKVRSVLAGDATKTIQGTATNDSAVAGFVGELLTASLGSGSATSLSTGTAKTIISLSLTAGDWDVYGVLDYIPAAATTTSFVEQGVSQADNTLGSEGTFTSCSGGNLSGTVLGSLIAESTPYQRISLASTTTVYLIGKASFAVSTMTAYGTITARRAR